MKSEPGIQYHSSTPRHSTNGSGTVFKYLLFTTLLLSAGSLFADNQLGADLGDWVNDKAVPKFSELLTRHPRLKGSLIQVMAMEDGYPVTVSDELTQQIKSQLIDGLLKTSDVRIALDNTRRCQPLKVDNVLGIEVKKQHNSRYRIALAMVDVEEGIWLNGSNISWQGKITNDQKKAYRTPFSTPTEERPIFNLKQTVAITQALIAQLQCAMNIPSPIYFEPVLDESIAAIQGRIQSRLSKSVAITMQMSEAASVINLKNVPDADAINTLDSAHIGKGDFTHTLGLSMASASAPEEMHRIATVKVMDLAMATSTPASLLTRSSPRVSEHEQAVPDLLSEIRLVSSHSRNNACQNNDRQCVDVKFSLRRPAYTVMFYSKEGQVRPVNCDKPARTAAGNQHYGLMLPEGKSADIPTTGFYVVAVEKRSTALSLNQTLKTSSHHCTGELTDSPLGLIAFKNQLKKFSHQTDWQAIHLTRYNNQVIKL